ncbi:peptidylprolyl isomerase [Candidatus Margulisiibacteriota bacterium]
MVKFMRKYAHVFGWIIVLAFAGTMFSGAFLFRNLFFGKKANTTQKLQDHSGELAVIGNIPISKRQFINYYQEMYLGAKKNLGTEKINPEINEYFVLNAFEQATQYTAFLIAANEAEKNKVSKQELKARLKAVYKQFNLKNKKELKALLVKNKYPYKVFMSSLKQDIVVSRFANFLIKDIKVTDQDVENSITDVKLAQVFVRKRRFATENVELLELAHKEELEKVKKIKTEIQGGLSFTKAVKKYSEDPESRKKAGDLGWLNMQQLPPSFEKVAYALKIGEISEPIESAFGYHIIKLSKKKINRPKDFEFEKTKKELFAFRKRQVISSFLGKSLEKLKIIDPHLLAIQAKSTGQYQKAAELYQSLISKNPNSPGWHYLLARIYLNPKASIFSTKNAKKELNKASIKAELNPALDFPELHIELAKIHQTEKNKKVMYQELELAENLDKENINLLQALKNIYSEIGDKKKVKNLEREIKRIQELREEEINTLQ